MSSMADHDGQDCSVVIACELSSKRIGDIWPPQGTCGSFLFDSFSEGEQG